MATPQATAEHYRHQQRLTVATLAATRAAWQAMTPQFDASWPRVLRRLLMVLAAAQLAAARSATAYVPAVLEELGIDATTAGEPSPRRLVGTASDGRPLGSLLYTAVIASKRAVGGGAAPVQALDAGRRWLDVATWTQVADAARQATSVGIAARPAVTGWVRMVNPPCCKDCAVLAGRHYRWSDGFERHPSCDCRHIPATEDVAGDLTTDPDALRRQGLVTNLTAAERDALEEGADFAQVVNAARGRKGLTTTAGATRRGGRIRLTPEGVYREAGGDRDEAIRLLRLHGYIV